MVVSVFVLTTHELSLVIMAVFRGRSTVCDDDIGILVLTSLAI